MNLFKRFGFLALGAVFLTVIGFGKSAQAVSYYGLSCTNKAYGTQNQGVSGAIGYTNPYIGMQIDFSITTKLGVRTSHGCNWRWWNLCRYELYLFRCWTDQQFCNCFW